jgi:hypothetical protein
MLEKPLDRTSSRLDGRDPGANALHVAVPGMDMLTLTEILDRVLATTVGSEAKTG